MASSQGPEDMSSLGKLWHSLPAGVRIRLLRARRWWRRHRPGRRVRWGNLRRRSPFSADHALDRGRPVDRYLIELFVGAHRDDICGDVMEMSRTTYTSAYGKGRVKSCTVVDIDRSNAQATHFCDLCDPGSLPAGAFDCIVLTQTLQYLGDLDVAIANLWQALRPDGVLLLTVPALAREDPVGGDYWRFTPAGLLRVLADRLPAEAGIVVSGYGNAVAAAAQIVAASVEDLGLESLQRNDPAYPVIVGARVVKSAQS